MINSDANYVLCTNIYYRVWYRIKKRRRNILPFTKHVHNRTNYLGEDIVTFKNTVNSIFVGYFVIFNTLKV